MDRSIFLMLFSSFGLLIILFLPYKIPAQNPVLSEEEIQQFYEDLGVILSEAEKSQIAEIVKPTSPLAQWRMDANNRIDQYRKADLAIELLDANGVAIQDATVKIKMKRNAFNFGVVVRAEDLTDAKGRLAEYGQSTNDWKRLVLAMANSIGTGNNFKPRLTALHEYLPEFLQWTSANDLYVRGHLLIWPGTGGIEDMDKPGNQIGVDYGRHLSQGKEESLHSISGYEHVKSYDVEQAVLEYKSSNRSQNDKDAVEEEVDAEISQWAGLWDVREWDVINETLSNRLLMEIMGYEQMAEWFKVADASKVNPLCTLFLNDYKIISAPEESPLNPEYLSYSLRKASYMDRLDKIIEDGGPISGIGFQNRYTLEVPQPGTTYKRLVDFGNKYSLPMVGTEFEIVYKPENNYTYDFSEYERARITEETLTAYLSHPKTTGLFNWTFMSENEEKALAYYDGSIKLNGLVWYYLHRIRYHTDENGISDIDGKFYSRGFKGSYDVEVEYQGKVYNSELELQEDMTHTIELQDVSTGFWHEPKQDIIVQPNPFDHHFSILSQQAIEKLEVADMNGHILHSQPSGKTITLPTLIGGSYFLICTTREGIVVKKIMKK